MAAKRVRDFQQGVWNSFVGKLDARDFAQNGLKLSEYLQNDVIDQ